tara:strand:+ start:1219 stop:3390 length:2172 start_codon:yes stop_codon:yes gene_type:complete
MTRIYLLLILILTSCFQKIEKKEIANIIPNPQNIIYKTGSFNLNSDTGINYDSLFLSEAKYLQNQLPFKLNGNKNSIILKKNINLLEEEYFLYISKKNIIIEAATGKGQMHGIQSLIQLLPNKYKELKDIVTPCVEIHDFPRFKWRGMLLDCCRHFMDKEFIKRYIDLLAYHKMNILHLHLTEDQGWRVEIEKYPKLTEIGAWRNNKNGEKYGGFYTKKDLIEIIKYAQIRHVEIIPEIELPGHSVAAIASYPQLSCTGKSIEVENDWGVFKDIYCAGNDSVYTFLENVLTEVIEIFPSKYIHIGGDEAPKFRWKECVKCQQKIQSQNLKDEHELQSYFIKRIEKFIESKGKKIIGWDEIIEGGIAPSATIQSWRGMEGGVIAAQNNHEAIMSPTSHCYFDYDLEAIDLKKVYSFEPIPKGLTNEQSKYIIGGECNMWSEHAPQETIDSKVFPRILAISEVLWSKKEKNFNEFKKRVDKHYKKLDVLGVKYGYEKTPIKINSTVLNHQFQIEIEKGDNDMDIEYSLNNGLWEKYTNAFLIDTSVIINVKEVNSKRKFPAKKSLTLNHHLALGKKTKYLTNFDKNYPGQGSLTNGVSGNNTNFRDGQWQGFFGKDVEVIIDLEEETTFSKVQTSFFQYHLSWIIIPQKVEILTSKNGEEFKKIQTINHKSDPMKEGKFIKDFIFTQKQKTRFIKIIAKTYGNLPMEHPAAGSKSWTFIDQIIIE